MAGAGQVHRGLVQPGVGHLAGHGTVPDQPVELQLLGVEVGRQALGRTPDAGGADGLVGLLRALAPGAVVPWPLGVVAAEVLLDVLRGLLQGLLGHGHRVGAHVGDQAHALAAAQVDALVELLGDAHGPLRREAQAIGGRLLQRRGDERRGRTLARLLALDGRHAPGQRLGGPGAILDLLGPGGVELDALTGLLELAGVGIEVAAAGEALPVDGVEPRGEVLAPGAVEQGLDVVVHRHPEPLPLLLALDDQAHRHALHPAGAQARAHLLPEDRRELVAVEAVQDAAALLGLDQLLVDGARVLQGVGDGAPGDLVERDAAHRDPGLEDLEQVPADGLPLPVLVGGEQQLVRVLQELLEFLDPLLAVGRDHVDGRELAVHVHGQTLPRLVAIAGRDLARLLRQVADMPVARGDLVLGAEELLDGSRLGGRLDDDQLQRPRLSQRR